MAKSYEDAYAEWPHTRPLKDGGIHVYGKYVQPMLPRRMFALACLVGGVFALYVLSTAEKPGSAVIAIVLTIVAYYALRPMLYNTF